jgi:hypothetical protein
MSWTQKHGKSIIMKTLIQTILFILLTGQISIAQKDYYTIKQIKDTLIKYENPFSGFPRLEINKIPISKFRKDSFLMKKAIQLLDIKYFREYVFLRNTNDDLKYLKKFEWERSSKIKRYLKNVRKIPIKKLNYFYDSIAQNPVLLKKYVDSVYRYKRYNDSINYSKYKWKTTPHEYITFHSKLMTQTSYDTIRAYYDRYYQNFNEDIYFGGKKYDAVIIALINMGDPELRAKYNAWFDSKLKNKEIKLDEYVFLTKYIKGSLLYKELAKILFYDYFIVTTSSGVGDQINGLVIFENFPTIDTLEIEERKKISSNMKGDFFDYFTEDESGNIIYKYKSSYQEFHKYYLDYVAYLEKKEKPLFDKIKYKTNK